MTRGDIMAEAELCAMAYASRHGIDRAGRDCFDVERDTRVHLAGAAWDAGLEAGYRKGYEDALSDLFDWLDSRIREVGE
jgi:hypothetical protein